jgi:hypothetical protein
MRSGLIWHQLDCLQESIERFRQLVLLFIDTADGGPAGAISRA